MCLAFPGKVIGVENQRWAKVDFDGVIKRINVELVDVQVGEYVVVHAGFAIEKLNTEVAHQTIDYLEKGISQINYGK